MSDQIRELTIDEVAARIGQPDFFVYDCNGAGRYKRGHVPSATWVRPYDFAASELPDNRDATLVFYCSGPG